VATPLSWAEVEDEALQPGRFTLATVRARLGGGADPWAGFTDSGHGLGDAARRLAKLDA
jgi:DNA primase